MSFRLSRLYGMDIYSDAGKYLGRVQDLILDLEKGEVLRITLEPLQAVTREDAKRILREKSILYKNVKSVEDVIMVSGKPGGMVAPTGKTGGEQEAEEFASFSTPGFFSRG